MARPARRVKVRARRREAAPQEVVAERGGSCWFFARMPLQRGMRVPEAPARRSPSPARQMAQYMPSTRIPDVDARPAHTAAEIAD
jgi:hypothetical protein